MFRDSGQSGVCYPEPLGCQAATGKGMSNVFWQFLLAMWRLVFIILCYRNYPTLGMSLMEKAISNTPTGCW